MHIFSNSYLKKYYNDLASSVSVTRWYFMCLFFLITGLKEDYNDDLASSVMILN